MQEVTFYMNPAIGVLAGAIALILTIRALLKLKVW